MNLHQPPTELFFCRDDCGCDFVCHIFKFLLQSHSCSQTTLAFNEMGGAGLCGVSCATTPALWPTTPSGVATTAGRDDPATWGFTESVAFQGAEFCKSCHQFNPDDFALNGKLIENTYEEWRQSSYAQEGIQCQTCHMPDRRHLWRGIHDAEMVKQAMFVTITPNASAYTPGDQIQAVITVTNVGVGHYLPTYVTPKIFVHTRLLDPQGQVLPDSAQKAVIGREVTLDLSAELYDTRIPPKASRAFTYTAVMPAAAVTLRVRVVVHSDHFYQRFFAATLQDGGPCAPR